MLSIFASRIDRPAVKSSLKDKGKSFLPPLKYQPNLRVFLLGAL